MKWAQVRVVATPEAVDGLAVLVTDLGAGGAVVDADASGGRGVAMRVYFPVDDCLGARLEAIGAGLRNLESCGLDIGKGEIVVSAVEEQDWADRKSVV